MKILSRIARFKKRADAEAAFKSKDYSKSEKAGKKGWRNARWEISIVKP